MSQPYGEFFNQLDSTKQINFSKKVCKLIIKGLGIRPELIQFFEGQAAASCLGHLTPEWFSEYTGCPIVFCSSKDYSLEHVFSPAFKTGVPDPLWLLNHRIDGPVTRYVWEKLWEDSIERFGSHKYVATCFRTKWSSGILALHNYTAVLTHSPSSQYPVRGGSLVWTTKAGTVILQYLRDLVNVLRNNWQYEIN